jgi:lipopolysaccharide/colanic/teichoic acid biosynthesis glycosyltransferase
VGSAPGIEAFLDHLDGARRQRPEIVATVAPSRPDIHGIEHWGGIDDPGVQEKLGAAPEVLFVSDNVVAAQRLQLFAVRGARGYLLLPSAEDAILMSSSFGWIGDQPLLEISVPCGYGFAAFIKRSFDLIAGVLIAVLSTPLWMAAAVAVALETGRPALIRQLRVGRNGVPFRMWKFRTMKRNGNVNDDTLRLADNDDPRVTRVGRVLRRYRLDELPQLINVFTGEMSLVGPRPEQPAMVEQLARSLPEFALRTLVRPGIAGLAQVSADYHTRAAVKLRYDLAYMRDWSFSLDLRILVQTVTTVLSGRGV